MHTLLFLAATTLGGCAATHPSSPPGEDLPTTLARREIEQFEGGGRAELAPELFGPGYTLHFAGMPDMDAAGHAGVIAAFHTAFPDMHIQVVDQVSEGALVASHIRMTGTHTGPFNGIPATGRAVDVTGTNLMRLEGGRIVESWGYFDTLSLLQQLGVAPAGPPRPALHTRWAGEPGSPGTAKEAVRAFADAFNAKDPEAVARGCAQDYLLDFPGGPQGEGVSGIAAASADFIRAFPDLHFATDALLSDGDLVAWRWTMTGTQRGPLGPFPASNKPVTLRGVSLLRVRDGKIVEDRVRADMVGLLQQIGAIPG